MTGKVLAKNSRRGPAPTTERNKKPKKKIPINAKIYTTLRRRIVKAAYAKSGYLPPELDLMDEFRVSRHTIRTALQKLVVDGLIERQRGTRTKIVRRDPAQGIWAIGSLDQMVGEFYAADDLSARVVKAARYPEMARLFGVSKAGSLFRVVRIMKSPPGIQNYSTIFTRVEFGTRVPRDLIPTDYFLKLLEKHCGLQAARVRQVASAHIPPPAARRALGLKDKQPTLALQRTFLTRSGDPIEHIYLYCHPDNYAEIVVEFYREFDTDTSREPSATVGRRSRSKAALVK